MQQSRFSVDDAPVSDLGAGCFGLWAGAWLLPPELDPVGFVFFAGALPRLLKRLVELELAKRHFAWV